MNIKEFGNILQGKAESGKMPVVFVGHGNPMFAITDNPYKSKWEELGKNSYPKSHTLRIRTLANKRNRSDDD